MNKYDLMRFITQAIFNFDFEEFRCLQLISDMNCLCDIIISQEL